MSLLAECYGINESYTFICFMPKSTEGPGIIYCFVVIFNFLLLAARQVFQSSSYWHTKY
jgi:hypothetical protein